MKKNRSIFFFAILVAFIPFYTNAQGGLIQEDLAVKSKILGVDMKYSVYLPADYEESDRRYPVLYLLHGFSPAKKDYITWVQFGEVKKIVDNQMQNLETTDMILVMPDFDESFYVNSYDQEMKYEDFFFKEFVPYIDENYQTRPEKQYRAIAGVSMGGYGTLLYAMKHPEYFAAAAPLSAAVITDDVITSMPQQRWDQAFGPIFGPGLEGADRLTDHFQENSILNIIASTDPKKLQSVDYFIDCGDDDFLIKGNMALHSAMLDKQIPHEFRVRDGGHTWTYWRSALPEVLKFVSQKFHK